uniref:Large ribosomal subunit protein uL30m n=1 Tax=Suricata suricatta TaxID=37032 RepID=A0A673U4Q3_SURSU
SCCVISLIDIWPKKAPSLICTDWIHHKFTKSRIPDKVFQLSPEIMKTVVGIHSTLINHIVIRIKSTKRCPILEKDTIKMFGLEKAHTPQVHKNIPLVNAKLKVVKHLIRTKPLKLTQGLPAEEDMSDMGLKSSGELLERWHLKEKAYEDSDLSQ